MDPLVEAYPGAFSAFEFLDGEGRIDHEAGSDERSTVHHAQCGVVGEGPQVVDLAHDVLDEAHGGRAFVFAERILLPCFVPDGFQGEDDPAVGCVREADGD